MCDPKKVLSYKSAVYTDKISSKDSILYSLGIGFSKCMHNKEHFKYTFEMDENFSVFPSYLTVMNKGIDFLEVLQSIEGLPDFNPMHILHGEETIEIIRPLQTDTEYETYVEVIDFADKVKGALLSLQFNISEKAEKKPAATIIVSLFIRKVGGFGFKGTGKTLPVPEAPKRNPDFTYTEKTDSNQAILYRLNGDSNPLHIDFNMAAMGGFDKPILHGLCFYGITARSIVDTVCKKDETLLQKFQARFTSHVFPGETLNFNLWREGNIVFVEGKTQERGLVVIKAVATLKQQPAL